MRVRGDLDTRRMRHLDHGRDLLRRHLRRAGHAAVRQYRAGRDHLEQIRAAVDCKLRIACELLGSARNAHVKACRNIRIRNTGKVQVAAAVRDREVEAHDLHARPRDLAAIDVITQVAIGPGLVVADIAHRGETRLERRLGLLTRHPGDLVLRAAEIDGHVRQVLRCFGDVDVHVDQAGQARVPRQVQPGQIPWMAGSAVTETMRPPRIDYRDVVCRLVRKAVDQRCAVNGDRAGVGRERRTSERDWRSTSRRRSA